MIKFLLYYCQYKVYIQGVPVLKVHIYIFEFQKNGVKILIQKICEVYDYRVISN